MSASRIITADKDRLENIHPGDVLRDDFLVGSAISVEEVGQATGLNPARITAILNRQQDIDAATDLRLARYFGMSDGFFLRLQNHWDIEEVLRSQSEELSSIARRAA